MAIRPLSNRPTPKHAPRTTDQRAGTSLVRFEQRSHAQMAPVIVERKRGVGNQDAGEEKQADGSGEREAGV